MYNNLLFGDARMLEDAREVFLLHDQKFFLPSFIFQTFKLDCLIKKSFMGVLLENFLGRLLIRREEYSSSLYKK
jgi:hypothetical protein